MADRYLKFSYEYYIAYTAGNWQPAITYNLPSSSFINQPYYSYQYGWYGFSAAVYLPAKLRLYQYSVTFHDRVMLDLMNPNYTNHAPIHTSPDDIGDVVIIPSSTERTFTSGLGTDDTYVDHHAQGYYAHAEIEMQNPYSVSVTGTATVTFDYIYCFHDNETSEYNALLAAYPNYVTPWSPFPPADRLYIGDDPVDRLYIGNNNVNRVYLRDNIIKE